MDGGSPGVLENGAGAEPSPQVLDASGMKPGAGQWFHSWVIISILMAGCCTEVWGG